MRIILNEMGPEKNKSLWRQGGGALSSWESGHADPFPPQDSVVRVYLSIVATTWIPRAGIPLTEELLSMGQNT